MTDAQVEHIVRAILTVGIVLFMQLIVSFIGMIGGKK